MTLRFGKAVAAAARAVPAVAALSAVIFSAASPSLRAASTKVWEVSEFKDFAPGKFENLSLTYEGRLTLGPSLEAVYSSDQPVIWDTSVAPDGSIYVATGHQGHVYRIDAKGESRLFWDAPEIEVFSIAIAPNGDLYAGTSPKGKIYRVTPHGEAGVFFDPGETYIWSLEFAPAKSASGSKFGGPEALFAATGEKGKIYRIDPSGQGEVYFDTEQRHVMSLAFDPQGRLLAGTDPNGILYRVDAKGKAFALYDSDLPEVRALQVAPNGDIYAAAMGGGLSESPQAVPSAVTSLGSSAITTITVNATAEENPEPDDFQKSPATAAPARGQAPIITVSQPSISYGGIEKAALLRVRPGVAVEKLWSSQEENILALSLSQTPEPELLFATDAAGRVYRLEKERRVSLVAQAEQDQITRLAAGPKGLLLSTAHSGKLYRLGATPREGSYQTAVFDSGGVSQWGRLSWLGETPEGTSLRFQTRTGNSGRADSTWSEWSKLSEPAAGADGEAIASPAARYIQWRVELRGNGNGPVTIDKVGVTYLPQNAPPMIHSVDASTSAAKDAAGAGSSTGSSLDGAAAYSVTVSASGNVASPASGSETQTLGGGGRQVLTISWQAEDPDSDPLTAEVHFRGEDETVWKLLKEDIRESKLEIDSDALADGAYRFRVAVSDRRANPPGVAESVSRVSRTILVDHTPPQVRSVSIDGRQAARFEASDAASLLQQAEYSLDASSWQPVYPDDGILDSRGESFTIRLADLPPGEHLITLRVRDRAGNAGLGKAVIR
jgi:sugar lactone lactonase YvrE